MTGEPTRLRDDPTFFMDTGCDLGAETAALDTTDLAGLGARIQAATAPPWPWRGFVGRAAAVGVAVAIWITWPWMGPPTALQGAAPIVVSAPTEVPAPTEMPAPDAGLVRAPATVVPAPEVASPAVSLALGAAKGQGERRTRVTRRVAPLPVLPASVIATVDWLAPAVADRIVVAPTSTEQAVSALGAPDSPELATSALGATSDLAQQLAAFEQAEAALVDGDTTGATAAYGRYLERWPDGHFAPESRLGTLSTLVATGDAAGAERLAARLVKDPALATRRAALLGVRAEALARLGRCDEATALATDLDRAIRRRVRTACR